MTHSLASAVIKAVGGRVVAAHVGQLLDDVFYATLVLQGPQGEARVDARPSDALALALASAGSITVDGDVFERVAREYPEESWDRIGAPQVLSALREQMQPRGQRTP